MQAVTHLASASAGAILSAFVRVPTDTLKHRVQAYLIPDVWRVSPLIRPHAPLQSAEFTFLSRIPSAPSDMHLWRLQFAEYSWLGRPLRLTANGSANSIE